MTAVKRHVREIKGTNAERLGFATADLSVPALWFATDTLILWYWDGVAWNNLTAGGGATDFISLTDTPGAYAGAANQGVVVNGAANALVFEDVLFADGSITGATAGAQTFTQGIITGATFTIEAQEPGASPTGSLVEIASPGGDPGVAITEGDGAGGVLREWDVKVSGADFYLRDQTGGVNAIIVQAGGNVGISEASPNELLEIGDTGRAFFGDGGGANRTGLLLDGNEGGTYARIETYDYGAGAGIDLAFNTAGHGNIGIWTTTPLPQVHVYNANINTPAALTLDCNGGSNGQYAALAFMTLGDGATFLGDAATLGWGVLAYGNAFATAAYQNDLHILYWNGTIYRSVLTLENGGSVGIGIQAPAGTLHVYNGVSGATPSATADDVVIENSGSAGLSLLVPDAQTSRLVFGNASDNLAAEVLWDYTNSRFYVGTAIASGSTELRFMLENANTVVTFSNSSFLFNCGVLNNDFIVYDADSGTVTFVIWYDYSTGQVLLGNTGAATYEVHVRGGAYVAEFINVAHGQNLSTYSPFWGYKSTGAGSFGVFVLDNVTATSGAPLVLVPNGAGDAANQNVLVMFISEASSGAGNYNFFGRTSAGTIALHVVGTDILTLRLNADGSIDVYRAFTGAPVVTFDAVLWMIWH